ncbi:B12-binding domain-containing radical SAM protein [Lactococcus nasutitermitis]|uniref:B12-binding domain-containing radical SAM protein n=1 Tax=Lactococcus nasutitermitis TaxID=1652957 RepID=A0ABV9JE52_9LACT|nr:radical SAM protein [Lactococcus nasutitermitis]
MKKSLLLIQPENPEIRAFRHKQLNNFSQMTMPYLAAFVDENLFDITLWDEYADIVTFDESFDLVAMTVNTPNSRHCYEMAEKFRTSGSYVVFGGPHPTLEPEEAEAFCDTIIIGEAEEIWPAFLQDFLDGKAQKSYMSDHYPSLEHLPQPRWDLLKNRSKTMMGVVIATRGCPYACSFCNMKQIYHDCYRTRPVAEVIAEIKALPAHYFVFWDDNLFGSVDFAKDLFREMAKSGIKKKFAAQVTLADCNDTELLALARKAGCLTLFCGIETFSEKSLRHAHKTVNKLSDEEAIIQLIHHNKLLIQAGIVFGFDGDDKTCFDLTLEKCERYGIDGVTVSLLTPLPKTPLYHQFKRQNRLLSSDWTDYNAKTKVVFQPKNMSADELFTGYQTFRKKFYSLNSFIRRAKVSKTHLLINFVINFGYWRALKHTK